jgi:anti-anti-sigma factor
MSVYSLTRVRVEIGRAAGSVGLVVRLGRRLEQLRGFLSMQVYRSPEAPETALVLCEWDAAANEARVLADDGVARLLARAEVVCEVEPARRLEPLFHVHFPRRATTAAVARLATTPAERVPALAAADKEAGLKAMAQPGTVGVFNARCSEDPTLSFCRLEFDGVPSLRRYLESPTCGDWEARAAPLTASGGWWRKEPRLEFWRVDNLPHGRCEQRAERTECLSLEIETDPEARATTLRFHGRLDGPAAGRFLQVRDALLRSGCRRLTLDLSDLGVISNPGLQALLETTRRMKEAGGHVTIIDNEGRFQRIVRGLGRDGRPLPPGFPRTLPSTS